MALLFFSLAATGCYRSHGPLSPDGGGDGGADSGTDAGTDASIALCPLGEKHIAVHAEPVRDGELCTETHFDASRILGPATPEPSVDGVRIHLDFAGAGPRSRPCDLIVEGIGADVATQLPWAGDVSVDWGPDFVSIQRSILCECDGCGCDIALVLYAADGDPTNPPSPPFEVSTNLGAVQCPAPSACHTGTWALHAEAFHRAQAEAHEGADAIVGPFMLRVVRDVSVFEPCALCATCGSHSAAWVISSQAPMCAPIGTECSLALDCCPGSFCCFIGGGQGACNPLGSLCFDAAH